MTVNGDGIAIRDRALGSLLGMHAGDSLGASVEFMSAQAIEARFPGGLRDIIGGGPFGWAVGEPTDDTQMALCILRSCVENGRVDGEDIARHFVDWMNKGPKDIGNQTASTLKAIRDGAQYDEAGPAYQQERPEAAGNGSLMRTAPIGVVAALWGWEDKQTVEAARAISAITHAHESCQSLCAECSLLIRNLVLGRTTPLPTTEVDPSDVDRGGWVVGTWQAALLSLADTSTFEEAVIHAVNSGGDTDTIAAVVGAIAGARHGTEAIPSCWREILMAGDEITALLSAL